MKCIPQLHVTFVETYSHSACTVSVTFDQTQIWNYDDFGIRFMPQVFFIPMPNQKCINFFLVHISNKLFEENLGNRFLIQTLIIAVPVSCALSGNSPSKIICSADTVDIFEASMNNTEIIKASSIMKELILEGCLI